ncbi:alpha/beta fold hydrolase [Aquibacillus sediminis]|uniref:alpha/beta fold hydrolase n=1 Tax=Aquibacillus sediminis TaxID=2574734 RepID=UPI0014867872|nr:alpha/beta hydrolase [Aquibacillus sediminis]
MIKVEELGTSVFYEKLGQGIPIIFIHPPGMGRRVFDYQKHLSDQFQLLLPDLSGHGDSTSPETDDLISQYVKEIRMILDHENLDKAIICGYSAGGMIAQQVAFSHPERLKALILSGGYPKVNSIILASQYHIGMRLFQMSPDTLAKILAFSHTNNRSYQHILYHHMKKSNVQKWYQFYDETLHYNCTTELGSIHVPSLIIYGNNAFWMKKHRGYYQHLPYAKIAYIKETFHQVPTKQWQAFNHVIRHFCKMNVDSN